MERRLWPKWNWKDRWGRRGGSPSSRWPADMRHSPCCLDGAGASIGLALRAPAPSRRARNEGARNAGRTMRPQPHAQRKKRTSESPRTHRDVRHSARGEASGLLGALPVALGTLAFVTDGTKQCGRERPDLVSCGRSACRRSVPLRQRRASGPHDSCRRAKSMQMGRIFRPGPHRNVSSPTRKVVGSRGPEARPCGPPASRPPAAFLRAEAAASTAPSSATSDDREPPLGGGIDRNISNHQDLVKRPTSDLLTIEDRL